MSFQALGIFCFLLFATPSISVNQKHTKTSKLPYEWSNSWVVEIEGGIERADEVAKRHGVINLGQVSLSAPAYICHNNSLHD